MVQPESDQQYFAATQINTDFESRNGSLRSENKVLVGTTKNDDDDEEYPMTNKPKGRAIIFSHSKHHASLRLIEREGAKVDRQRITRTLVRLGFETEICDDFTFDRIKQKLKSVAEDDHFRANCLVIVVMSHGTLSKLYAFDQAYDEQELWKPFSGNNCPSLKGKPKLFFIEACRGTRDGTGSFYYSPVSRNADDEPVEYCTIPNSPDLLIARSTFEGYKSYREPEGSRFIQTLCNELERDLSRDNIRKYDLMRILTAVNRNVAFNFPKEIVAERKQMPKIYSTLRKLVYFKTND